MSQPAGYLAAALKQLPAVLQAVYHSRIAEVCPPQDSREVAGSSLREPSEASDATGKTIHQLRSELDGLQAEKYERLISFNSLLQNQLLTKVDELIQTKEQLMKMKEQQRADAEDAERMVKKLKSDHQKELDEKTHTQCKICMESRATKAGALCGHLVCCHKCFLQLRTSNCPLCRREQNWIHIYF